MIIGDFHIHSNFSDGRMTIPQIVDLYGSQGFGAIAITDHYCEQETIVGRASAYLGCTLTQATFPLYIEIIKSEAERAWHEYKMVVIPGVELTKNSWLNHRSAHVLAVGIEQEVSANGEIETIVDAIHEQGALAIAAHPVWTRKIEKQTFHLWDRRDDLKNCFDAWEVASGPYYFNEVEKTRFPLIANSDLHRPAQMTSWKTRVYSEKSQPAILEAIRKQKIDFYFYQEKNGLSYRSFMDDGVGSCGNRNLLRD